MRTTYSEEGPVDPLTVMAQQAIELIAKQRPDASVIVGIDDPASQMSGFAAHNYEGVADLATTLLDHVKALIQGSSFASVTFEQGEDELVMRISFNPRTAGKDAAADLVGRLRKPKT